MGMYDSPGSDNSGWKIIRVFLIVGVAVVRIAIRSGDCNGSSSHYSYSSGYNSYDNNYPDLSYLNNLNSNPDLSALNSLNDSAPSGRVELPGMSIYPTGTATSEYVGDTTKGSVGGDRWNLSWETATVPTDKVIRTTIRTLAKSGSFQAGDAPEVSELRDVMLGEKAAKQATVSGGDAQPETIVTVGECTGRLLVLWVTGTTVDMAQAESDGATSSFYCEAPPKLAPRLAEKKGWEADASDPPGYSNDHGVYVTTMATAGSLADDPYDMVVGTDAFYDFTPVDTAPKKSGKKYTWTGMYEIDGEKHPGAVIAFMCGDDNISIVSVSSPERKYVAEGMKLAATAACQK